MEVERRGSGPAGAVTVDDGGPPRMGRDPGRRRSASIYGTIVTAAVLATGGNQLSTAALEATVLTTLVVYWLAEQYAELLGQHTHAGRLPGASQVRASLRESWPMVSASFLPSAALLLARLGGASALGAASIALVVTVILLVIHGHAAGKSAGLKGVRLTAVTAAAGLLGIVLVALKAFIQHHHHLY
jgi:hypothetical protein